MKRMGRRWQKDEEDGQEDKENGQAEKEDRHGGGKR